VGYEKVNWLVEKMIKITKINPLKKDKRGLTYGLSIRETMYVVILNSKKGSVRGEHYHKGKTTSKSPETFFLAKGKIKLYIKNIKTNKKEEFVIEENNLIEIPAMIYHKIHSLTDSILIEFNTEKSDFKDETVKS
jgi:dTDP-4-dehydrorhamnose 3,5-epimerase-like enzyme